LVFAGEEVDVGRFADGGLVSVGGTGDVGADGPATGILLHKSLNYISNDNIILCKFKKRHLEILPPLPNLGPPRMRKVASGPSINTYQKSNQPREISMLHLTPRSQSLRMASLTW
jgi:hypothetical protein